MKILSLLVLLSLIACNSGPWKDHPPSPEDVYRSQKKQLGLTDSTHPFDTTAPASVIDPFGMMNQVFAGRPDITIVKPLIDSLLTWHHLDVDDYSRTNFAQSLLWFRRDSRKGVTEMQILKVMHQNFTPGVSLFNHIKQSADSLEKAL